METQLIHVLLVASRDQASDWVTSMLRAEAEVVLLGVAPSLERASVLVGQRKTDVILLDSLAPDARQLDRLQAIASAPAGPVTIVMAEPGDMTFVQQAMFAGARGFLFKPFTQVQLLESLRQTFQMIVQQRQALNAGAAGAPAREASADILAVFSPKGGVGRTSVATNLSVALHQVSRKPVTLVDGDLQFGDIDIAVNVMARKSIADLLGYINELEPALMESVLIDHSSGIRLLLAPPYFDPALEVDQAQLAQIVKALAGTQEGYVVVDTPSGLAESNLNLLDVAQRILLVTAASVASLRATKHFLDLATKLDYVDKVVLVLNGHRKDTDVPIAEIERVLGQSVAVTVPADSPVMALALNQGQPIMCRDRNHTVSKAMVNLARHLHAAPADDSRKRVDASLSLPSTDSRPLPASTMRSLRPKQALSS